MAVVCGSAFAGNEIKMAAMKAKFILSVLGGSMLLGAASLSAQIIYPGPYTNSLPTGQSLKYPAMLENDRDLGEQALFPPGLREKLQLTDEQRAELRPIEADFAKTSQEYQVANQPRIDAAKDAIRVARGSKNEAQIQSARHQLQTVWAGLQQYRDESIRQVKRLLTPDQVTVLEDPANQWREDHANEANDPSAH
jgi:hypothetical protein